MEIKGVAIRYGELVVCLPKPNRHPDVIHHMAKDLGLKTPCSGWSQGFYLEDGSYLNRESALKYVKRNFPDIKPEFSNTLYSEDLW